MFADPQSVTINAVAVSLPRTGMGLSGGSFQASDGNTNLVISHTIAKRNRHLLRLNVQKTTTDPLLPSTNQVVSMSAYVVVDVPKNGYSAAEQKQVVDALVAYLAASSGAKVTQLLGGES